MSFGFLGSFRQTQWRSFRQFILNERRAVDSKLAVINAELERIGEVVVLYSESRRLTETGGDIEAVNAVSERRTGFFVPEGTSLHKLIQVYIALGGNPCDISLFLTPDRVLWESDLDPEDDPDLDPNVSINDEQVPGASSEQPGFGVVAPESDNRSVGGGDKGGWLRWGRYPIRRVGRFINISEADQQIAYRVDLARRWANPSIQHRRNNIEARIVKLMDLREQLQQERDDILMQAVGGSVRGLPLPDPRQYSAADHLVRIVEEIDNILYQKVPQAQDIQRMKVQQLAEIQERPGANLTDAELANLAAGAQAAEQQREQVLSQGITENLIPDFNSANVENISQFDTIWPDDPEDDRYTAL